MIEKFVLPCDNNIHCDQRTLSIISKSTDPGDFVPYFQSPLNGDSLNLGLLNEGFTFNSFTELWQNNKH